MLTDIFKDPKDIQSQASAKVYDKFKKNMRKIGRGPAAKMYIDDAKKLSMPAYKKGGKVNKTGPAFLHKGTTPQTLLPYASRPEIQSPGAPRALRGPSRDRGRVPGCFLSRAL